MSAQRVGVVGAAAAALLVAGVGAAVLAAADGETTGTATFTNVVTFTVPTVTETSPPPPAETVTVTVTTLEPPPPPPTTTATTTTEPPPAPPAPASVYVAANGNDSAACTSSAPCKTFTRAYTVAAAGAVVSVKAGSYPNQYFAGGYQAAQGVGSKAITFRGEPGNVVHGLHINSPNMTFDGINIDGGMAKSNGGALHTMGNADNFVFRNGSVGRVADDKGAEIGGTNALIDNVRFYDVTMTTAGANADVHNECIYALETERFTIRKSRFENCSVYDLTFTFCTWCGGGGTQYGNVTVEDNFFGASRFPNSVCCHYYGFQIGATYYPPTWGNVVGWKVRRNVFENTATIAAPENRQIVNSVFCGNTGAGAPAAWKVAC